MKEKKFTKLLIGILIALMIFAQPSVSLQSFAASKSLKSLPYVSTNHSFDSYNYPSQGITTPDGKEYSNNIIYFDASLEDCHVTYNLNNKYEKLTGKLVTSNRTGNGVFNVTFWGDGRKLKSYRGITKDSKEKKVDVNVTGVKQLKITAENTRDYGYGWVYFVDTKITTLSYLSVSDKTLELYQGDMMSIGCTYKNTDASKKASWSTSNKNVCRVSTKGQIRATGTGKAVITCKYKNETKKITVIVRPNKVTGLKASSRGRDFVQLSWKSQPAASGYKIYSYDKYFNEYQLEKTVKKGASTSGMIKNLKKNTSYKFKVRAYFTTGGKTYYGDYSKVITVKTNK